jgi:hypothetical protein
MRAVLAGLLALVLGFESVLAASPQFGTAIGAAPKKPGEESPAAKPEASVAAMGISLERIRSRLAPPAPATAPGQTPLKLDYYVEVLGAAPEIELFTTADLDLGQPVPGSAITHAEMLRDQVYHGPEWRSYGAPVFSMAIVGAVKLTKWQIGQIKKHRAEEARKKRKAEEQRLSPELALSADGKQASDKK